MAYSTITGAKDALEHLLTQPENRTLPLPQAAIDYARKTKFTGRDSVFLPCVMKEVEASAALKAVEAGMAAAIGELRYGWKEDDIEVNMERAGAFLFMVRDHRSIFQIPPKCTKYSAPPRQCKTFRTAGTELLGSP